MFKTFVEFVAECRNLGQSVRTLLKCSELTHIEASHV